jgi:hypothetical protein
VAVGDVSYGLELHAASMFNVNVTFTLKMEAACTSEIPAMSPTTTQFKNPRTELTSIINHCEGLKSICISYKMLNLVCYRLGSEGRS